MSAPKEIEYLDKTGLAYYNSKLKQYINERSKIFYDTTENWDKQTTLIGGEGYIYIYSDWCYSPTGEAIAGFKVGDGITLLKDTIFVDQIMYDHMNDNTIHITQQEREKWNNKVSCSYTELLEKLKFEK